MVTQYREIHLAVTARENCATSGSNSGEYNMKTIATFNAIICALVFAIAVYLGLDPKKLQTWLVSVYCFLSLFFAGIMGTGNFFESGKVSAIITFALVFGGIITYWCRERAKKWLIDHHKEK